MRLEEPAMPFAEPELSPRYATGTNAAAAVTYVGKLDYRWRIKMLCATVSAGAATLTLTSGGVTVFVLAVTPGAPILFQACDIESEAGGDTLVATLSAAGSSNVGNVFMDAELL